MQFISRVLAFRDAKCVPWAFGIVLKLLTSTDPDESRRTWPSAPNLRDFNILIEVSSGDLNLPGNDPYFPAALSVLVHISNTLKAAGGF
jgi:hypothetical protein